MSESDLLSIPDDAAAHILRDGGVYLCRPLRSAEFVRFCNERGISITQERLLDFERIGIFCPIFRLFRVEENQPLLRLPIINYECFQNGVAIDTTHGGKNEALNQAGCVSESYYSQFQIASLSIALSQFTINLNAEALLENRRSNRMIANVRRFAEMCLSGPIVGRKFRSAIDILCQYISDRYYPYARSDGRTLLARERMHSFDEWIIINGLDWNWQGYSREWDAHRVERTFNLNPGKLRHAYEALCAQQLNDDPLANWYQLVQFVTPLERQRLKGKALAAETMRGGALMLRLLFRDLYGEELPHPNEVYCSVITPMPELEARSDARRYMELVVNRFGLNPAPKLTLFVEGISEDIAVREIFVRYFGAEPGKFQIEIINLGGVDNATGSKKEDRFRAILRLVDYLHHHQTFTFMILDNENYAKRLKSAAKNMVSTINEGRYITRHEYIKIWNKSFEFDNFSATEIARAMTSVAQGRARFLARDVLRCKAEKNAGAALADLYLRETGSGLRKKELTWALVDQIFDGSSRKKIGNRPIVEVLERVTKLARRNPFPTMEEIWLRNQSSSYLGKVRKGTTRRTAPKKQNQRSASRADG